MKGCIKKGLLIAGHEFCSIYESQSWICGVGGDAHFFEGS